MMKISFWLSAFLLLVIGGCGSTSPMDQPTLGAQLPSTFVSPTSTNGPYWPPTSALTNTEVAITTTKLPTSTNPSTATPVSILTLEPEQVRATIEPLLREPLNCTIPCFWGIVPGKTHLTDARNIFSRLGYIPFVGKEPTSGKNFFTVEYELNSNDSSSVTIYSSKDWVDNIVVTPRITLEEEGSPREWIAYSPESLIKKFGEPSRVEFALDWGPNFVIVMILYFDAADVIALYSGYNMIPDRPHSPLLCPLTAPFDHIRLWMGTNPPNPPQMPSVPLEKATSLTLNQFTQLMLGDPQQACFTINGDSFQ